jgi:hypothetical protein
VFTSSITAVALMMAAANASETSVNFYKITRCNIQEHYQFLLICCSPMNYLDNTDSVDNWSQWKHRTNGVRADEDTAAEIRDVTYISPENR